MENPIKMDDLGGKPTIFGNTQIVMSRHEVRQGSFGRARHALLTKSLTQPLPWWNVLGRCMKSLYLEHLHSPRSGIYIIYVLYYINIYYIHDTSWYQRQRLPLKTNQRAHLTTVNKFLAQPTNKFKSFQSWMHIFHQNTLVAPSVCSDAVPPSTDSSNQRPDHQVEYSHQPARRHPLKGNQSKASEKQQILIPMNKNWWTVMKHVNVFV